jgi:hypothetical protein
MSFSLQAFQALDLPPFPRRELPRKARHLGPPPARAAHPLLLMAVIFLATSLAVIGLWQGLVLLLPH